MTAAQPSLPHDELSVAIANCLGLYHVLDADKLKVSRLKALILAQRQEAVEEALRELRMAIQEGQTIWETNELFRLLDLALQTYLEGEQKKFDRT